MTKDDFVDRSDGSICRVDRGFIEDSTNLYELPSQVCNFFESLKIILGPCTRVQDDGHYQKDWEGEDKKVDSTSDVYLSGTGNKNQREVKEKRRDGKGKEGSTVCSPDIFTQARDRSAQRLYGLIHARYILTDRSAML